MTEAATDAQLQKLRERIHAKRVQLEAYIHDNDLRRSRIANLSILGSTLTAALMIGPSLGGEKFTENMQAFLGLPTDTLVWRLFCLGGLALSIAVAVLNRSVAASELPTRLAAARACAAKLEGLETALEFGVISVADALKSYQQCLIEVPFLRDEPTAT